MVDQEFRQKNSSENFIRIQDLWEMFISKWYWFAVAIFISFTIAVIYLLMTSAIYIRTASILIKDNADNTTSANNMSGFSDSSIFKSNTNIKNELLTLKSPSLMKEVVSRLNLDMSYTIAGGLKSRDLYKETPVIVTLESTDENLSLDFDIELYPDNKFVLSHFVLYGKKQEDSISGIFSDSVATPVGVLTMSPTSFYGPAYYNTLIHFHKGRKQNIADIYIANLKVELANEESTITNLSIRDTSIQRAEDILNTLITVYSENWILDKSQMTVSTSQFINDRLGMIENELNNVDENISKYKSQNLLPDVQAAYKIYMAQSAENKKELLKLNSKLSMAQYIRKNLSDESSNQLLPTNSEIDNANIENQIEKYNNLLLQRNTLLSNSSEKNPLVIDINQSLSSLRKSIIHSISDLIVTLDIKIKDIQGLEMHTTDQIASSPNQAKYLISVERQQKIKEELYLYLLQKREENVLSQAYITYYNTRVITPPLGSLYPVAPRKGSVILFAFAIGLFLPAVLIFMKENMTTTVRGHKDIKGSVVSFIGEIPWAYGKTKNKFFRKQKSEFSIVVKEKSRNMVNEAFRIVRTNLEFMIGQEEQGKVIMFSSFNSGAGKTFISMNLAVSLAIKNKKVLLIDLDMRCASISNYIDSPKIGVVNYLGGQIDDWNSVIAKERICANLDILPVGIIPSNPTELLFSSRMEQLLANLRERYDYIFIDCPPVEVVADCTIISKWVDMTIFVVRTGLLKRCMLPEIDRLHIECKYKNMALLLNATTDVYSRYNSYHYGSIGATDVNV